MIDPASDTAFVDVAGLRTHLLTSGRGDPVILLHGAGPGVSAAINWSDMLGRIGRDFRCIAPDLPGFGQSAIPDPLPEDARAWARYRARHLVGLLDALGIERAAFIGNSRGGGSALVHLLLDAPERCERAVIMGGGGIPYLGSGLRTTEVLDFYKSPTIETMATLMRLFVHDLDNLPESIEAMAALRTTQALLPGAREAFVAMSKGVAISDADVDRLAEIVVPLLLIHGARDVLSAPEASYEFHRRLGSAHLHIFPDAGHWSHVDKAAAFAMIVRVFLNGQID